MLHELQEAPKPLTGRMFQQQSSIPKEQRILVLKTGIAGMSYRIPKEETEAVIKSLVPGTELLLYRDVDNEHDQWAINVHMSKDKCIGYVTRYKNETIARLMDMGKKFIAIVDKPETEEGKDSEGNDHHPGYRVAYTEKMKVPFSIYMIEEV